MTVGGNLIEYPFSVATKTTDIVTAEILFNSVLSTPGGLFCTMDIGRIQSYQCDSLESTPMHSMASGEKVVRILADLTYEFSLCFIPTKFCCLKMKNSVKTCS